jgi:predicted acylesterase/phospholipase RssA
VSVLGFPDPAHARDGQGVGAALLRRLLKRFDGQAAAAAPALPPIDPELGLISILAKSSRVVQTHIATARLRDNPPDQLITVRLPDIGLFDFHRAGELIAAGRAAARDALPELRARLAAAAPLSRKVARWLDGASARLRRDSGTRRPRRAR